jgi:hypothetical protein
MKISDIIQTPSVRDHKFLENKDIEFVNKVTDLVEEF